MRSVCALIGLAGILAVGATVTPAAAEFFGCNEPKTTVRYDGHRAQASANYTHEFAAQTSRPRVTIHRKRGYVGQNAVRQCRSTLVKEWRVSGPVIVPRETCWWE